MKRLESKHIEDFLEFEKEFGTFDLRYKNKQVWPQIRYAVYDSLLAEKGLAQRAVTSSNNLKKPRLEKLKKIISIFKLVLKPIRLFKKTDIFLFNYERVLEIQDKNYNPLVWAVQESLSKEYKITVIDIHGVDASGHKNVIDLSGILSLSRFLTSKLIKFTSWYSFSINIQENLKKSYGIQINWPWVYSNVYFHQKMIALLTLLLVKLKKPKFIFYTDTACFSSLIEMSKNKNLVSVDFQHALQSGQNILYRHHPKLINKYKDFISDHTLTFGDYWNKYFSSIYSTHSIGNSYHEFLIENHKNIKQFPNAVTIISDGEMAREALEKLALGIEQKIPEIDIYYKLRQDEFPHWKDFYSKKIQESKKIQFISSNQKNLYYYLKKSRYVIGINSTALIEALPLSNVLVYETGWFIEFIDFIKSGHVLSAPNIDSVVDIIKNKRTPKRYEEIENIFKSGAKLNLKYFVEEIEKKEKGI